MKEIYLDNAATTRMKPEVLEAMLPYFTDYYGNASGVYSLGARSKMVLDQARGKIASTIGAYEEEIFFTSGGSESDNWALKAVCEAYQHKGKHIITTQMEHHAILHTASYLETRGFEVTYLPVDHEGFVSLKDLEEAMREDTILVSVMYVNNEIGSILPIKEIGELCHKHGILFHTDAVQAYGHIPIHVKENQIDLMSVSAHKFHGPKGVGFLYIKNGLELSSFIHGGSQERGRRAGTENIPGIVGMAKAAELAHRDMVVNEEKISKLRDYMIHRVMKENTQVFLNGPKGEHIRLRASNNVHLSFAHVAGESFLIRLDMEGVAASAGSACTSGSTDPSHVLLAIGMDRELAYSSLRFTLSEETTREEIDRTCDLIRQIVNQLRELSPIF